MNISLISGVLALALGLVYTILALALPEASIGIPFAPRIFPSALGIAMILFSIILIFSELKKQKKENDQKKEKEKEKKKNNPYLRQILLTCVFSVLYAVLFNRIGYVFSTVLFLEAELWLFNGIKKWKLNTVVAVAFSLFIYIVFSKLLGVYLPLTPGIWI